MHQNFYRSTKPAKVTENNVKVGASVVKMLYSMSLIYRKVIYFT